MIVECFERCRFPGSRPPDNDPVRRAVQRPHYRRSILHRKARACAGAKAQRTGVSLVMVRARDMCRLLLMITDPVATTVPWRFFPLSLKDQVRHLRLAASSKQA